MFDNVEKYCKEIKMLSDLIYLMKCGLRDIGEKWNKG